MTKLAEHMEMKVHIMHSAFKESIFEFAMTAELKKWRRIFYSLSLHLN